MRRRAREFFVSTFAEGLRHVFFLFNFRRPLKYYDSPMNEMKSNDPTYLK